MDKFFTWELLATYAGSVIGTTLLVQWLKGVFAKLPTRILSYIVALILLVVANFFLKTLTLEVGALCILNAFLVSLASNGAFDAIAKKEKE